MCTALEQSSFQATDILPHGGCHSVLTLFLVCVPVRLEVPLLLFLRKPAFLCTISRESAIGSCAARVLTCFCEYLMLRQNYPDQISHFSFCAMLESVNGPPELGNDVLELGSVCGSRVMNDPIIKLLLLWSYWVALT